MNIMKQQRKNMQIFNHNFINYFAKKFNKIINRNSLEAHEMAKKIKRKRYVEILSCYEFCEKHEWFGRDAGATDRDVRIRLGYNDMNEVRPRITELLQMKYLEVIDNISENGRRVRACCITDAGAEFLKFNRM